MAIAIYDLLKLRSIKTKHIPSDIGLFDTA